MFISILSPALILVGAAVTILFWVPGLVNRVRLKDILGKQYPMIYMIYVANGPLLLLLGILLYVFMRDPAS